MQNPSYEDRSSDGSSLSFGVTSSFSLWPNAWAPNVGSDVWPFGLRAVCVYIYTMDRYGFQVGSPHSGRTATDPPVHPVLEAPNMMHTPPKKLGPRGQPSRSWSQLASPIGQQSKAERRYKWDPIAFPWASKIASNMVSYSSERLSYHPPQTYTSKISI